MRFGGFHKNIAYKYYNKWENLIIPREADFVEFIFMLHCISVCYPTTGCYILAVICS